MLTKIRNGAHIVREEGQTMAEYGVILAVITPAIIAALALVAYKTAENLESVVAVLT